MTWKVATEEVPDKDAAGRPVEGGGVIAHAYDPDSLERSPGAAVGKLACDKSTAGMIIRVDESWATTAHQKCRECYKRSSS
jgi:hypothetical protein